MPARGVHRHRTAAAVGAKRERLRPRASARSS